MGAFSESERGTSEKRKRGIFYRMIIPFLIWPDHRNPVWPDHRNCLAKSCRFPYSRNIWSEGWL